MSDRRPAKRQSTGTHSLVTVVSGGRGAGTPAPAQAAASVPTPAPTPPPRPVVHIPSSPAHNVLGKPLPDHWQPFTPADEKFYTINVDIKGEELDPPSTVNYRDSFLWNAEDQSVTAEAYAKLVCEDEVHVSNPAQPLQKCPCLTRATTPVTRLSRPPNSLSMLAQCAIRRAGPPVRLCYGDHVRDHARSASTRRACGAGLGRLPRAHPARRPVPRPHVAGPLPMG